MPRERDDKLKGKGNPPKFLDRKTSFFMDPASPPSRHALRDMLMQPSTGHSTVGDLPSPRRGHSRQVSTDTRSFDGSHHGDDILSQVLVRFFHFIAFH
jgi:hypothetical protein